MPGTDEAQGPIRVREVRVLSDAHYVLRSTVFDYLRRDGSWQTMSRESYDRGNGAAILPYDPARGEDFEVLEPGFDEALRMINDGRIVDAKTIMLLQHVRLAGLL